VYVTESSGSVLRAAVLEIGARSTLTFVRAYNFKDVPDYQSAADALLSTDGKYLYMTNPYGGTVTTVKVDSTTGSLKYISTADDGGMGDNLPLGLAISGDGAFVFSGNVPYWIGILAAGTDGSLTSLGTFQLVIYSTPNWLAAITF
jgi:6-phosphogluconolactonase (cycloisomerase 2 family)